MGERRCPGLCRRGGLLDVVADGGGAGLGRAGGDQRGTCFGCRRREGRRVRQRGCRVAGRLYRPDRALEVRLGAGKHRIAGGQGVACLGFGQAQAPARIGRCALARRRFGFRRSGGFRRFRDVPERFGGGRRVLAQRVERRQRRLFGGELGQRRLRFFEVGG